MLFISHDLALVRHVADKVVVMYLGKVMEKGTVDEIFGGVTHPYTEALLSAVRSIDPDKRPRQRIRLEGEMPSPIEVPRGCRFRQPVSAQGGPDLRPGAAAGPAPVRDPRDPLPHRG
jgi:peptide/nickel transport system ATP-binding protein